MRITAKALFPDFYETDRLAGDEDMSAKNKGAEHAQKTVAEASGEKEIEALMTIIRLLEPMTKEQRERILRYARDKFGIYMGD